MNTAERHEAVEVIAEAMVWAGGAGAVAGASRVGMQPYERRAKAILDALTEHGWTLTPPQATASEVRETTQARDGA